MKNTKIASILISVCMTILVFTGCGSPSKATNAPKPLMNNTTRPNENNGCNQAISTDRMKTLFTKTLKDLVIKKTITQTQSDKVLAAITKNTSQSSGTTNLNPNSNNGTGTNMKPNSVAGSCTCTSKCTCSCTCKGTCSCICKGTTEYSKTIINELSSLVKSRVITQVQANIIYQKIQEGFKQIQCNM